jgi:hypothetical protein
MTELIVAVVLLFLGFMCGIMAETNDVQERCVAKYASMPHNEVGDYCKTILKFQKEAK